VAIASRIMTCGDYFLRLLARRDYSVNELLKKGREKGFEQSEIAEAIDAVQQKGYQSDIRVVNSIINSSKGQYGKAALKRKCLEKGIAADVFEQVWMEQTESDSTESLSELKAKVMRKYKLSSFQYIDPKTKAKLLNYLQYRGFNPFEVLDQWKNEEEEAEAF
jgi:regulatory protein